MVDVVGLSGGRKRAEVIAAAINEVEIDFRIIGAKES